MDKRGAAVGIGAPSILVAFTVICLVALALMTLSAARADMALTEKTAAAISDYYAAETEAAERLAACEAGETAEFSVTVDENRELRVKAVVTDTGYDIVLWQVFAVSEWTPDDGLDVVR